MIVRFLLCAFSKLTLLKVVPLIKMQDRKKVQHDKVHVVQKRGLGISPKLKKATV